MQSRRAWPGVWSVIGIRRTFWRPEDQVFNLDWKPDDVKPAEFVAKYGQAQNAREDFSKKKKLTQAEIGQTLKSVGT